jgi:chromosome segregation ATPase
MTNPLEQAQQQLRELRDSLQAQLAAARMQVKSCAIGLAEARTHRDDLEAALKRVEASLTPRTRKRKEPAAQ